MKLQNGWKRGVHYGVVAALLLSLSACGSPQFQQRDREQTTPKIQTKAFVAADRKSLPIRRWMGKSKPKAIVVAIHGFNDYSRAFEGAGEFLSRRGIAVIAFDQRGFGANDQHGIWAGEENLVRDVSQLVGATQKKYPKTPIYLLGESMGGAVAIETMATFPDLPIDGVILSAPAVWGGDTMNWLYRITLWATVHTFPSAELTGGDIGIVATDNNDILRQMIADPLIIKATRVDAIYGIVNLMDSAHQNVDKINKPTLLLYGKNDQVIPRLPVVQMIDQISAPLTVAYYPQGYHMLLRDHQAQRVLMDIESWINNHSKPLPSGKDKGVKDEWRSWAE